MKDFELDLKRRERQLTELILRNERSEHGFNTSPSFVQSDIIDFNKSAERISTKSANIDNLISQFQSHQKEALQHEQVLNKFLERDTNNKPLESDSQSVTTEQMLEMYQAQSARASREKGDQGRGKRTDIHIFEVNDREE